MLVYLQLVFPLPNVNFRSIFSPGDIFIIKLSGPYAHLFVGNYEQNAIPAILAYASCIGDGLTACG